MDLPVGGSVFSSKLTTKLHLDFSAFNRFVEAETFNKIYSDRETIFSIWFTDLPQVLRDAIDPRVYFALIAVQNGMEERLSIAHDSHVPRKPERDMKYLNALPKLSDFRDGSAFCAEQAALGQAMLQSLEIPSVYMSGVSFHDNLSDGADHSWIVLYPDTEDSLIFDIARPEQNRLPNIYKPEAPFSQYIFENKDNAFVETKKLLRNTVRYFGVSDHPNMTMDPANIVKGQVHTILAPLE